MRVQRIVIATHLECMLGVTRKSADFLMHVVNSVLMDQCIEAVQNQVPKVVGPGKRKDANMSWRTTEDSRNF